MPIGPAVNVGIRRGQVLDLPWRHVDLDAARLVLDQPILSVEYGAHIADVETRTATARSTSILAPWPCGCSGIQLSRGRSVGLDSTAHLG